MRTSVFEALDMTEPLADLRQRPPIWPGFAGCRTERALARDHALGIGDGAVLLAPGQRRQQQVRELRGIGRRDAVGTHDKVTATQRLAYAIGLRQANPRLRRTDPYHLSFAGMHRSQT